jgi:hypothetical protein
MGLEQQEVGGEGDRPGRVDLALQGPRNAPDHADDERVGEHPGQQVRAVREHDAADHRGGFVIGEVEPPGDSGLANRTPNATTPGEVLVAVRSKSAARLLGRERDPVAEVPGPIVPAREQLGERLLRLDPALARPIFHALRRRHAAPEGALITCKGRRLVEFRSDGCPARLIESAVNHVDDPAAPQFDK